MSEQNKNEFEDDFDINDDLPEIDPFEELNDEADEPEIAVFDDDSEQDENNASGDVFDEEDPFAELDEDDTAKPEAEVDEYAGAFNDDVEEEDLGLDEDGPVQRKSGSMLNYMIYGGLTLLGVGAAFVVWSFISPGTPAPSPTPQPVPQQVESSPVIDPENFIEEEVVEEVVVDQAAMPVEPDVPVMVDAEVVPEDVPVLAQPQSDPFANEASEPYTSEQSAAQLDENADRIETLETKMEVVVDKLIKADILMKSLQDELNESEIALSMANEKIAELEKAKAVTKKPVDSKPVVAAKPKPVSTGSAVNKAKGSNLDGYSVQSIINNKAWVTYKDARHVVSIGDSIPGAGKVIAIDANAKTVRTTAGLIK